MTKKTQEEYKALLTDKEISEVYDIVREYGCNANRVALTNDIYKLLYNSKKNWMSKIKQKTNQVFKNVG
jgi:hypothetical protein